MSRALMRISHEITEKNKGVEDVVLIGIRRRGVPISERIRDNIKKIEDATVPCGSVDIRFYRDDLTHESDQPVITKADIGADVNDKNVVLVDDVLYTGRTARAAIEAVFTALALRDQFAPPTIHYEQPDPECDLDYVPNVGREMKMEYALSNSLGFGGHNAAIALRRYTRS